MFTERPAPKLVLPLVLGCALWATLVYAAYLASYLR
jgi:hypothetical protein